MHPSPHPIGYHWGNCQMLPRDILTSLTDNCQAQRSGPWVNLRQGEAEAGEWVPQVSTGTPSVLWKPATTRWRQLHTLPHFLPQTHSIPSSSCFRLTFVLNAIFSLIFFFLQIFLYVSMLCGDLCWLSVVLMARLFFLREEELASFMLPFLRCGFLGSMTVGLPGLRMCNFMMLSRSGASK